jgi:hypothetical protein
MKQVIRLKRHLFISRSDLPKAGSLTYSERINAADAWIDINASEIKEVKPGFISITPLPD